MDEHPTVLSVLPLNEGDAIVGLLQKSLSPEHLARTSLLEKLPIELLHQVYFFVLLEENDHEIKREIELHSGNRVRYKSRPSCSMSDLLRINHFISSEILFYFFKNCRFCFPAWYVGRRGLTQFIWASDVANFRRKIGRKNADLVRKITLFRTQPEHRWRTLGSLAKLFEWRMFSAEFPALRQFRLSLNIRELLPIEHYRTLRVSNKPVTKEALLLWDWSKVKINNRPRSSFERLLQHIHPRNIDIGVYWTEGDTSHRIPEEHRELYDSVDAEYKAGFLLAMKQWTKASSVASLGTYPR